MSTLLVVLVANLLQINAKQSSLRSAAFEAVQLLVEQQYKIEGSDGWKAGVNEIQATVARELDGEAFQWTVGTTYTSREASMATFSTSYDLLRGRYPSPSMASFCTPPSWQLLPKFASPRVAFVLGCRQNSPPNSTQPHCHSLHLQLHWYVATSLYAGHADMPASPMLCYPHGGRVFGRVLNFLPVVTRGCTMIAPKHCCI